jgi:hypothetical protein|tara:strand:+ start:3285 stop:3488 length:204 start_codon:yes stop_codon:yes gene_type:complete
MKKVIEKIMKDIKSLRNNLSGETNKEITLSKEELEFLLQLIAKSNFEGRDVQLVYETAVKIQQLLKP